jgi:hypothetical protein
MHFPNLMSHGAEARLGRLNECFDDAPNSPSTEEIVTNAVG